MCDITEIDDNAVQNYTSFSLPTTPPLSPVEAKTDRVYRSMYCNAAWDSRSQDSSRSGGSIKGGTTMEWGDKNGIKINIHMEAELHDRTGNDISAKFKQYNEGTGSVDISGTYKTDFDDRK